MTLIRFNSCQMGNIGAVSRDIDLPGTIRAMFGENCVNVLIYMNEIMTDNHA